MITSEKFDRLKYHFIKRGFPGTEISELVGLDSETLTTGAPFLFCLSDGTSLESWNLIETLLRKYPGTNFALWNLKFDSGSIIYDLPPGAIIYEEDGQTIKRFTPGKYELWTTNKTTWHYKNAAGVMTEITLEYIPHKYLKIFEGKNKWVKFWDICQFYASSLDNASKKYLSESKGKIETKEFTPSYVEKNIDAIKEYCIRDASLTARLGNYLLQKLDEFGLRVTALYSQASISFRYFQDNGPIIGVSRYYKSYPDFLRVCIDSYEGGKFELTTRGCHPGIYEYDLTSAYPREIADLVDVDNADILRSTVYQKDSYYAFMRCKVKIYDPVYVPAGLMINGTRVYCIGEYFVTLTKNEYLYYLELGAEVEILDGWFLFINKIEYPYRENVYKLFELKSHYKEKGDAALTLLCKVMLNGFYGKFCQVIEDWEGNHNAGVGFNPIYAAIITANTRLKVARLQNRYGKKCLGVHTDSVMLTEPLDPALVKKGILGEFEFVDGPSPGVLVLCGCYQIGDAGAFKGFEPRRKKQYGGNPVETATLGEYETWFDILSEYKHKTEIPYKALRVESWVEATSKGHFDKINKFEYHSKTIDLNADIKRLWLRDDYTGEDFLSGLIESEPVVVVQSEPPDYWKFPRHIRKRFKYGLKKDTERPGPGRGNKDPHAGTTKISRKSRDGARDDNRCIKLRDSGKPKSGKEKRTGLVNRNPIKSGKNPGKKPLKGGRKCPKQ